MSLRARLVITLVTLTAIALGATGAITYGLVERLLVDRVDSQLLELRGPAVHAMTSNAPGFGEKPISLFGTYTELRDPRGTVIRKKFLFYSKENPYAPDPPAPNLPPDIKALDDPNKVESFTVGGGPRFRAMAFSPLADAGGGRYVIVIATPLSDVDATLQGLVSVEYGVAAAVLALMTVAGLLVVRLSMSPLDRMARTADQIAGGDLSARVKENNPHTEIGRLDLALNAMLEQLEAAFDERRANEVRLRKFLADASHELRTPLTSIRGYAELFGRGASQRPDDLATVMKRIEDEGARMGVLVESLLTLARIEDPAAMETTAAEFTELDLTGIVIDATEGLRAAAPDRTVTLDAPEPVLVRGNDAQLRQLVNNLLTNARTHTAADTPIDIRVTTEEHVAVLTVRDHGEGLEPEAAEHMFDRFWRSPDARTRPGSGLGLALVAAIVRTHSGHIAGTNAPDGGAVFTARLPLAPSGSGDGNRVVKNL